MEWNNFTTTLKLVSCLQQVWCGCNLLCTGV